LLIAEIGVNHNGSVSRAHLLIKEAKQAGADAAKFQMFRARELSTREAPTAPYQKTSTRLNSQMEMLRKLELSLKDMRVLFAYARRLRLGFFVSVFDEPSLDDALKLGVPVIKLGSGELTNLPLVKKTAQTGRTIVMSTGMSELPEVARAVRVARAAGCAKLCLMHCVTAYPAKPESLNLRKIPELARRFRVPVGFSDHSTGNAAAIGAVALGACMIEKHFTLDRKLDGPDHKTSCEPEEFSNLVRSIRAVEKALGSSHGGPDGAELLMRRYVRKSIVSAVPLERGTRLTRKMLAFKRPGTGIPPDMLDKVLGKRLRLDVAGDTMLSWDWLK
jgi:sialic acid synthase SpsE